MRTSGTSDAPQSAGEVVDAAQRIADEVLFPAALETDAAGTLPRERLDVLAAAGLYGLRGPTRAGGMDADLDTICAVTEALASGCLTTTFVWAQHVGTVFVVAASGSPSMRKWVVPLCRGEIRSGLALTGALPGPRPLRASRVAGGWQLSGAAPWVSGWGRTDVVHTAAVTDDGSSLWALVDAREGPSLRAERVELAALNATATVDVTFEGQFVPDDRVTVVVPPEDAPAPAPASLRVHAAFALGVVARCCRLLGASPLDVELSACRRALAVAGPDAMPEARAGAAALAVRAAVALMSAVGSSSLRLDRHPQRLAREALFVSVFAARSPIKEAFLARLGAAPTPPQGP